MSLSQVKDISREEYLNFYTGALASSSEEQEQTLTRHVIDDLKSYHFLLQNSHELTCEQLGLIKDRFEELSPFTATLKNNHEVVQLSKAIFRLLSGSRPTSSNPKPLTPPTTPKASSSQITTSKAHLSSSSGILRGIPNVGNSCYINSSLQAVLHNPNLVQKIMNYQNPEQFIAGKTFGNQGQRDLHLEQIRKADSHLRALQNFIRAFQNPQSTTLSQEMEQVRATLRSAGFNPFQNAAVSISSQQDGVELLQFWLDLLGHSELQISAETRSVPDGDYFITEQSPQQHYSDVVLEPNNTDRQTATDITLIDRLEQWHHQDRGTAGVDFDFRDGKGEVKATRHRIIQDAPDTVYVNLLRYKIAGTDNSNSGNQTRFNGKFILPDSERIMLNTQKDFDSDPEPQEYEIQTLICQMGSLNGGHYISFKKVDGQWYKFNDGVVTLANYQDILRDHSTHFVSVGLQKISS